MDTMRVCAQINLNAIEYNLDEIKGRLHDNCGIICVIKTDAYGHGAVPIAKHIEHRAEVWGFAVATAEEAVELHHAGIVKPILLLGYTFSDTYETVARYGFRPTIFSVETAKAYAKVADELAVDIPVHIKLDTGMGRIGFRPGEDAVADIKEIFTMPRLIPEGIFTHFARADEKTREATERQLYQYNDMLARLADEGIAFRWRHCANSAAIMDYEDAQYDLVRAGIILYGLSPSDEITHGLSLQPLLSLKSHIVHIKTVEKGDAISYGGTYVSDGRRRIATIPVGYGDGYSRGLSGKGAVLIRGRRAPIVGRICMDQFMVDVTEIPDAAVADEVTLIGQDGDACVTMEELGRLSGRFNYEFACDLGNRIPRLYLYDGKVVDKKTYYE